MADTPVIPSSVLKDFIMRFAPAAAALSFALILTASMGQAATPTASPRAAMLIAEGEAALADGQPQKAVDAFEAALTVDPDYSPTLLLLAEAARREGLQGKAIGYYRETLERDPGNLAAISGEGAAMVEKGAIEKARLNLAKLESLCGDTCPETRSLAAALANGPQPRVLTAEAVMPDAVVTQDN